MKNKLNCTGKNMTTAKENNKRGKKFEALIEESASIHGFSFTRLRDVPHLTTRIMMLEKKLRAMGARVEPGPMSVQPNPCDCIVTGAGLTIHYEAKSTLKELKWADIKQWRRPDEEGKGKKLNDYWNPEQAGLSGLIVQFCDVNEVLFIPCNRLERLYLDRKTGFDYDRAKAHGVSVSSYVPPGKRTPRLDLKVLHMRLRMVLEAQTV